MIGMAQLAMIAGSSTKHLRRFAFACAIALSMTSGLGHTAEPSWYTGPVMDMHVHAFPVNAQGNPPTAVCVGEAASLQYTGERPWPEVLTELVTHPRCAKPFWSPLTDSELQDATLSELDRLNIVAVVSGTPERVAAYAAQSPNRVIPALYLDTMTLEDKPGELRRLFATLPFKVLGEVHDQYNGMAPDDARMDFLWEFAAQANVPVGIHLGVGPPGAPFVSTGFRARLHSPLALEEVLIKHPNLRIVIMHAAWPMIDELKAMLYNYPQLYVDTGSLQMALPRVEYHRFLEALVVAGFADRIMFGSDQIVWPGLIEEGIKAINTAQFLTLEQKQALLYDNARRFLRLQDTNSRADKSGHSR